MNWSVQGRLPQDHRTLWSHISDWPEPKCRWESEGEYIFVPSIDAWKLISEILLEPRTKRVKCFPGCAGYHFCWWFPFYYTSHFSFQAHFTSIHPTVWTGKEKGSNIWALVWGQPSISCTFPESGSDLCVSPPGAVNSLVSRAHREGPRLLPLTLSLPTLSVFLSPKDRVHLPYVLSHP